MIWLLGRSGEAARASYSSVKDGVLLFHSHRFIVHCLLLIVNYGDLANVRHVIDDECFTLVPRSEKIHDARYLGRRCCANARLPQLLWIDCRIKEGAANFFVPCISRKGSIVNSILPLLKDRNGLIGMLLQQIIGIALRYFLVLRVIEVRSSHLLWEIDKPLLVHSHGLAQLSRTMRSP